MPSMSNTYDEFASQYAQLMLVQERAEVEPGSNIAHFLQVVGEVSGLFESSHPLAKQQAERVG